MKISKKLFFILFLLSPYPYTFACGPEDMGALTQLIYGMGRAGNAVYDATCFKFHSSVGLRIVNTLSGEINKLFTHSLNLSFSTRLGLAVQTSVSTLLFPVLSGMVFAALVTLILMVVEKLEIKYKNRNQAISPPA